MGLLLFLKDVSGTPIFKILVRTLVRIVRLSSVEDVRNSHSHIISIDFFPLNFYCISETQDSQHFEMLSEIHVYKSIREEQVTKRITF